MKKQFNWSRFPLRFLKAVLVSEKTPKRCVPYNFYDDADYLCPYMDAVAEYPDDHFVRQYRREIEDYFLPEDNHLTYIAEYLAKKNYGGVQTGEPEDILFQLRKQRLTSTLIDVYRNEILKVGFGTEDWEPYTDFTRPLTIDLLASAAHDVSLYPYQQEAITALKQFFIDGNKQSGILVMPTGSGKTITSSYFLLREMAAQGYEIIWLAHRFMLVEQAASVFYKLAPLVKEGNNEAPDNFTMTCVSGKHATSQALSKKDDLVIGTVQSLCRKTKYITKPLKDKVIIVVDEAHHTIAPSYRRIIDDIRKKRPAAKLLGLTATPVKYTDKETEKLMGYFENNIIYSVPMSKLIADGTLAKPINIRRETNVDIEARIDEEEMKRIRRRGELTEDTIALIAKTNERNDVIVDEYVNNQAKYGKTIIFALNGYHCGVLTDALQKKGIKCDYVYTWNSDADNQEVIKRFRDNEHKDKDGNDDHIDVLVNINILTEGSDIPDIQTVFLTRPTGSDTLLMQMIGRGMRGIGCGGTETVNIVDFCDKWSSFTRWLNPKFLLEGEGELPPPETEPTRPTAPPNLIPMELIIAVMKGISYSGLKVTAHEASLPVGWYNVFDEEGNDEKVIVFASQEDGYRSMERDIDNIMKQKEFVGSELLMKYFTGFGLSPDPNDLVDMAIYVRYTCQFPEFHTFEQRDEIDPGQLAVKFNAEALPLVATRAKIDEIYAEHKLLIDSLYGNRNYYERRIVDFMMYPNGVVPIGTRIEEAERIFYKLDPAPFAESLDNMLDEVLQEQSVILGKDFIRPSISWTDRAYKCYFAQYEFAAAHIKVNAVLNSVSVPKEVIKFLIYHECLHQLIPGHGTEFRQLERKYPDFEEHEHFLDYTFPDYYRESAM